MIAARSFARNLVALWLFFVVAFLIADIDIISRNLIGTWFSASAISALGGALLVALIGPVITRDGRVFTVAQAGMTSVVVGLLLGVIQVLVTEVLPVDAIRQPVLLIVSAGATIGILGMGAILFVQVLQAEQRRRNEVIDEATAVTQARDEVADIAQRMRTALSEDIDAALSPARAGIAERLASQERQLSEDEWPQIARQLRDAASETIRPLSRKLWQAPVPELPPITIPAVVRNVVTQQPFQPVAMALIGIATFFSGVISTLGWLIGLATLTYGVAATLTILGTGNAFMRRWPDRRAAIFIAVTLFTPFLQLPFFPIRSLADAPAYTWTEFAIAFVIGVVLIFVTSGFGSIRSFREDSARILSSEIDQELADSINASREVAQLARESARILHGTVQTRLIACAVAIERAADTHDAEAFQAALAEAQAILADPTRLEALDATSLTEEVQRKVDLWSSLCNITVTIDPKASTIDGQQARDIGRVVEEGLSNAIRHGEADSIDVRIETNAEHVTVTVTDDGSGPKDGPRGLGSSLLDSVSEAWTLRRLPRGSELTVSVSWASHATV